MVFGFKTWFCGEATLGKLSYRDFPTCNPQRQSPLEWHIDELTLTHSCQPKSAVCIRVALGVAQPMTFH